MKTILRVLGTPSFWGTILGLVLVGLGHDLIGPILLACVGIGGCGIALHLGVEEDRDPWRVDTVVEAIWKALTGRNKRCLIGLITHLGQAMVGICLLAH